jgi:hypothetical protein
MGDNFHHEDVREVIDLALWFVPKEVEQNLELQSMSPNQIKDIAFVFKTSFLLDLPSIMCCKAFQTSYSCGLIPQQYCDNSQRKMSGLPIML